LVPADSPRILRWRSGARWAFLTAQHRGYSRLTEGVVHRRSVLMNLAKGTFQIEDRLEGEGRHRFLASFHLAPGWSVVTTQDGWTARRRGEGPELRLLWRRSPQGLRLRVEDDLHSPSYGITQKATTVRVEWEGSVPVRLRYELVISGADSGPD